MSALKREGDGATPLGLYRILAAYYRPDRIARPKTRLPLTPITPRLGWCDAVNDRNYNKKITLPYPASHECLTREDDLYNVLVVLDYNISCRKKGAGSAIFFHLAHDDFSPTEGCVAVHQSVMLRFLAAATPQTRMKIERP